MLRTYKVFISHAWHRDDEYWRVVKMLDQAQYFYWENLSVPEHDPIDSDNIEVLQSTLRDQIRDCCVFVITSGMWVPRSDWILFEIQFARRIGRPIIGVPPWGQINLPTAVAPYADKIVSRQDTLVQAIRTYSLAPGR